MNADVVAESNTNETAGDVAERCHAKKEVIQILRAAEGLSKSKTHLSFVTTECVPAIQQTPQRSFNNNIQSFYNTAALSCIYTKLFLMRLL